MVTVEHDGVVIHTVEASDTMADVIEFALGGLDRWGARPVLWDLTLFDFRQTSAEVIRSVVERGSSLAFKRAGQKSAIVVGSELGYGMARMLQLVAEAAVDISFGVFRTREEGLDWLHEAAIARPSR